MGGLLLASAPPAVTIPSQAAAWGYNTRTFSWTGTTADISTTTSYASAAGGSSVSFYANQDPLGGANNDMGLSATGGVLTITGSSDLSAARGITTAITSTPGAGAVTWKGKGFKTGWYVEVVGAFAESKSPLNTGFTPPPAVTMYSFMGTNSTNFIEYDICEFQSAGAGAVGYYNNLFANGSEYGTPLVNRSAVGSPIFTESTFHKFGGLWVPTTLNSGTGLFNMFCDDIASTGTNHTYTLSGAHSAYAVAEVNNQISTLIINAGIQETSGGAGGPGWPFLIKSVNVYQASSSDVVVQ